jgi:hypothetical protein
MVSRVGFAGIGDLLGCRGRNEPASSTALATPAVIDLMQAFRYGRNIMERSSMMWTYASHSLTRRQAAS